MTKIFKRLKDIFDSVRFYEHGIKKRIELDFFYQSSDENDTNKYKKNFIKILFDYFRKKK